MTTLQYVLQLSKNAFWEYIFMNIKNIFIGFIAGFISTIVFHQGILEILFQLGIIPTAPYSMIATKPFAIPGFISLAFWGGVWGIIPAVILRHNSVKFSYWFKLFIFGGIFPPLCAALIVFPLKGILLNYNFTTITLMFMINAIWGIGTGIIIRIFRLTKLKMLSIY
jgi:hypothetical protein